MYMVKRFEQNTTCLNGAIFNWNSLTSPCILISEQERRVWNLWNYYYICNAVRCEVNAVLLLIDLHRVVVFDYHWLLLYINYYTHACYTNNFLWLMLMKNNNNMRRICSFFILHYKFILLATRKMDFAACVSVHSRLINYQLHNDVERLTCYIN